MTEAYPLKWPDGWPRTPAHKRQEAPFRTQSHSERSLIGGRRQPKALMIADALQRIQQQIDLLGATYTVLSSNVELRLDGKPRSGAKPPDDPGVALYFQLRGKSTVMPCDRYNRAADNIAAIAAHIDAVRRIERYGVGTIEQMFSGFQAIRGPGPKSWREVLGIKPSTVVTIESIAQRVRELAKLHHPDVAGGGHSRMAEINAAIAELSGHQ